MPIFVIRTGLVLVVPVVGPAHQMLILDTSVMTKFSGLIISPHSPDGDPAFFLKKNDPLPVYRGHLIAIRGTHS